VRTCVQYCTRFLGLALTIHPHIVPMVRMSRTMPLLPFFDETSAFTFPIPGFRRVWFGTA